MLTFSVLQRVYNVCLFWMRDLPFLRLQLSDLHWFHSQFKKLASFDGVSFTLQRSPRLAVSRHHQETFLVQLLSCKIESSVTWFSFFFYFWRLHSLSLQEMLRDVLPISPLAFSSYSSLENIADRWNGESHG